jgi:signal transduction histidine kinase/CheY-like chemotaxis protein
MDLIKLTQPLRQRPWFGYGFGVLAVAAAYGVRLALNSQAASYPFIIFIPAVVLTTFLGGVGPGALTAILALGVVEASIFRPDGAPWDVVGMGAAFFFLTVGIDIAIIHFMVTAFARAERAQAELRALNLDLERRVADRTVRLEQQAVEREQAEAQVRQMQKMEAVGQLTGGVAHDFNNLLTIIKSSAELLGRPNLNAEQRVRYVSAIAETAERAAKLTQQLLAFARRQPLTPTLFDVDEQIGQVLSMLGNITGPQIDIAFEPGRRGDQVDADLNQFETALLNMAVNGRDAMPQGGALTVSVRRADQIPTTRGHAAARGDYVAVSIRDTGAGMPPEVLKRIFEPFFTTKEVGKGTGLGLSQVYGFAKQSRGEIIAESAPGAGSTFTLFLPRACAGAPAPAPTLAEALHADPPDGACILVVEDNKMVGAFATRLLEDLGYGTVWAQHAAAALDEIEAAPDRFHAVFTDVVMPGMSGVELALQLRRTRPGLPVILTSGYSETLAAQGAHGFELLLKPYNASKILAVLRRVAPLAAAESDL